MSNVVIRSGLPKSPAEIEAQLRTLEQLYGELKFALADEMFEGKTTRSQAESQLLVLAGSIMLCQWALGRKVDPPIELRNAGWTPPPGFVL